MIRNTVMKFQKSPTDVISAKRLCPSPILSLFKPPWMKALLVCSYDCSHVAFTDTNFNLQGIYVRINNNTRIQANSFYHGHY